MKKLFIVLLAVLLLTGCAGNSSKEEVPAENNEQEETAEEVKEDKTLVVYFSITGNTKEIAQKIAEYTEGDIYEIIPAIPYEDEDLDYYDNECRSHVEQNDVSIRPEIGSEDLDIAQYSVIYIGYPIWYGQEPRIMDTFVEKYDLEGKTVIPFCTSDNSPIDSSAEALEKNAGSGNWLEGQRFAAGADEELISWLDSLNY